MVVGFRRSLSLPKPNRTVAKTYHVRSTSLPCRSHPSTSQLLDQIQTLRTSWQSDPDRGSSAWVCAGLELLKRVHDSLDDLLQLPQSQTSLRRRPSWVNSLLEDSLLFVDAFATFRAALVALKEEQLAAQVAIRRRDEPKISFYLWSRKKIEKEVNKSVTEIKSIRRRCLPVSDGDAELAGVVGEVSAVTVLVSVAAFGGISSSKRRSSSLISWVGLKQKKRNKVNGEGGVREFQDAGAENVGKWKEDEKATLKRMKVMEEWMVEIEKESEKVFRSLMNARVSLLNALT